MGVLLRLALALADDGLPETLAEPLAEGKEEIFAVEAFLLTTSFDDGLHIGHAIGVGTDFNFRWRWNGKTRFGFHVGAAFWDADTDLGGLPDQDADIVQYRAGVGAEFPFSKVEIGLAATIGAYRFRTSGEADTAPFLEFEGSLGFRPIPELKIGGLLMMTNTESSFTRSHDHFFTNYSAGLAVEWSF